jgi:predicted metal-dependent enzyme (double-stranded beta helix superfamily)
MILALGSQAMLAARTAVHVLTTGNPASGVVDLAADIDAACEGPRPLMERRLVAALTRAVADSDVFTPAQRIPSPDCYARHVVYGDPAGRFTILSLVWMPGQFSPPHAHQTWCAYAVCDNTLTETEYAFDRATMKALPLRTVERRAGYCTFGEAGLDQIHRLGNAGVLPAISLHVYGVESGRIGTHVNRKVDVA